MAVNDFFSVLILSPLLSMLTAGSSECRTVTPFSSPGLNSDVNTAVPGKIKLLVLPSLSAHSAQYISGPICSATFPTLSFTFSLAATLLTSIGRLTSTTSPFFHFLCNTAYPFSILYSTACPLILISAFLSLLEVKEYRSEGTAWFCAHPGMRIKRLNASGDLGETVNFKLPFHG